MWLKPSCLGCLAHASYLIADETTGTAVVVDPQRDVDPYLHDDTESMCGKNLSSDTFATLGTQQRFNGALQPMSNDAFMAPVTADQPEVPPYSSDDAMLNRRERPALTQTRQQVLKPLTPDEVVRRNT